MMIRTAMLGMALAFASPAVAFEDVDGSLAKLSESEKKKLIDAFDIDLIDGKSTRFRNLYAVEWRICGVFNAKNAAGNYTGYARFFLVIDSGKIYTTHQGDVIANQIAVACPALPKTS